MADKQQRDAAIKLFWDLSEEQCPPVKRDDPSTWESRWVADRHVGIMAGMQQ